MTVKELRETLKCYNDDDVVLIEDSLYVTKVSEVDKVKYKHDGTVQSFQTFDYEADDWDTTQEYEIESTGCLIVSEGSYIRT